MSKGVRIFEFCLRPFQSLPLSFHYKWGKAVAWLVSKVLRYRRDVVMVNLSRSFPDIKWKGIRSLANDFYSHFGDLIAEAVWFGGCANNPDKLRESGICKVLNPEVLVDAYNDSCGVVLLNSHLGNWELTGGLLQYMPEGIPFGKDDIVVVYKKLKSDFWDEFLKDNRCAAIEDYQGYIESNNILRHAISNRKRKMIYLFPTDQYPYRGASKHDIPDFLNQKTVAMTGGAALANKLHMAVVSIAIKRNGGRGKYEIEFRKICDDASAMSPEQIMTEYYKYLEMDIKADPANYLWSHNRWK